MCTLGILMGTKVDELYGVRLFAALLLYTTWIHEVEI